MKQELVRTEETTENILFKDLQKFNLDEDFVKRYENKNPFTNDLRYITYKRTYSRKLSNGKSEEWIDTVRRVVEGSYTIQKTHCTTHSLPWNEEEAQESAQKMFDLIFNFKFTPPGRGLWMMGTDYMYKRGATALNNCAFVSTEDLAQDLAEPFCFLMDSSMLGVGVGGDTKGAGSVRIEAPKKSDEPFVVPDTREGWVEALRVLLQAYQGRAEMPSDFDYSEVRPLGAPINGFGGVASGPEPLKEMIASVSEILDNRVGQNITSADIVDIFNLIGKCVVSGNVRRSAEIMFGEPEDQSFLELKDPEKNEKELYHHRWASNNSIFAKVGMDYSHVASLTAKNGEPGYEWLDNAQKYSRMNGVVDNKDYRARGGNPCLEQTLESYELCCLVETYPGNHETIEEWHETLRYAFLYAKSVTLMMTHNPRSNRVIARNRRIGASMSGLVQAFKKFGRRAMFQGMDFGYAKLKEWDQEFSERFGVPMSIKITSVKPSGTVSLLAGCTSGIHYPYAEYYFKNMRLSKISELIEPLREAGYPIEEDPYDASSYVVSFPVKIENFDRGVADVTLWEQLENVAQIQQYWADNQVSVTVTFKPEEAKDIGYALELYESRLKGVSFLPYQEHSFKLPPYEPISSERYDEVMENVRPVVGLTTDTHEVTEKFCDGDACEIDPLKKAE